MNNGNNNNLISIGNEIISNYSKLKFNNIDSISNTNNILTTKEETITKSTNDDKIKKNINHYVISNSNINNNNKINNYTQKNLFLHSTLNPNDTKKSTYSNLSKLLYKDGLILKDAANPNPGYGLWAIKLSEKKRPLKQVNENENSLINSYNSNIYSNKLFNNINNIKLNENSLSDSDEADAIDLFKDNSYDEEEIDKIVINRLTKRSNKLEKRYKLFLHKYYEQENLYINLEKIKKEYEQLINDSVKEKNEIHRKCGKLDDNNQALMNSISNARKEIERLINAIKEEQIKMKNEIEEYNKTLIEEELKRKKIIAQIKYTEKQIYILQDKIEEENNANNVDINTKTNTGGTNTSRDFNKTKKDKIDKSKLLLDENTKKFYKIKKETKREKEYKINRKMEYIKELQEELERLKIEDEEKLKEKRELYELINEKNNNRKIYKINMDKMYNQLEIEERKNKWNNRAIKIKNNIINSLKRYSNSK